MSAATHRIRVKMHEEMKETVQIDFELCLSRVQAWYDSHVKSPLVGTYYRVLPPFFFCNGFSYSRLFLRERLVAPRGGLTLQHFV